MAFSPEDFTIAFVDVFLLMILNVIKIVTHII